jgi:hypothetical protein
VLGCLRDECRRSPPLAARLIGDPGTLTFQTLTDALTRSAVSEDAGVRRAGEELLHALASGGLGGGNEGGTETGASEREGAAETRAAFGAALQTHLAPLLIASRELPRSGVVGAGDAGEAGRARSWFTRWGAETAAWHGRVPERSR